MAKYVTRTKAKYVTRTTGISISWHYVANLWRDNGLKPHRQYTFKVGKDPAFSEKVVDIVGLYLDPPEGALVPSVDEKALVQGAGLDPATAAHRVRHRPTPAHHQENLSDSEQFLLDLSALCCSVANNYLRPRTTRCITSISSTGL
jgi:hypothetical protein